MAEKLPNCHLPKQRAVPSHSAGSRRVDLTENPRLTNGLDVALMPPSAARSWKDPGKSAQLVARQPPPPPKQNHPSRPFAHSRDEEPSVIGPPEDEATDPERKLLSKRVNRSNQKDQHVRANRPKGSWLVEVEAEKEPAGYTGIPTRAMQPTAWTMTSKTCAKAINNTVQMTSEPTEKGDAANIHHLLGADSCGEARASENRPGRLRSKPTLWCMCLRSPA